MALAEVSGLVEAMVEVSDALKAEVAGDLQGCLAEAAGMGISLLDTDSVARASSAAGQQGS